MVKLLKLVLSYNVFITGSGKKERGVQRELLGVCAWFGGVRRELLCALQDRQPETVSLFRNKFLFKIRH